MRHDMSKVIVERPRKGGNGGKSHEPKGYKKRLQKALNKDETWHKESNGRYRRYGWSAKEFTERLGPLRKYLRSKIGQSWDDVWSEICLNLRNDNVVQNHVREHVTWFVAQNVVMVNGRPRCATHNLNVYSPFYVNPNTGILCETPFQTKKYGKLKKTHKKFLTGKDVMHQYHLINYVWYEVELHEFPITTKTLSNYSSILKTVYDAVLNRRIDEYDCKALYGFKAFAKNKRQLNTKEIKKLKLWERHMIGALHP